MGSEMCIRDRYEGLTNVATPQGTSLSKPGDFGALIVSQETKQAMGIIIGSSPDSTLIGPISKVLNSLEVDRIVVGPEKETA